MSQALGVWWDGGLVGMLRVDQGDMTFTYASEWLADQSRPALSVSLPKQPETFKRHQCRAFFAGLLPEEDQRLAAAQSLGISRGNDFRLLEALVIAGNSDAHGKNFSLLYEEGGIALAPLYDLLCTVAYSQLSAKFAMKIAKAATLEDIRATTWPTFAEDVGVGASFIRMRVRELTGALPDALPSAVTRVTKWGLDSEAVNKFAELIDARATRLGKTI